VQKIFLSIHNSYFRHDTGGGEHPEIPDRLSAILDRLHRGSLAERLITITPRRPERSLLNTVHDENYLLRLEESSLSGRSYIDHRDNQICFESFEAILYSAGAALPCIDQLEEQTRGVYFCCVRPPGHHAERALALGFCFLNNAAIAARYWQLRHRRRKIMIIDWDAHHGNGIQSAFEEESEVFYISLHEHPTYSFPGSGFAEETGMGQGKGATLNIPLPPGADDRLVQRAITEKVEPALRAFQPECLIISAGFDGHCQDDMSGLRYSTELYNYLGKKIGSWGRQFCEDRIISILEGGYHLESLAASVESYLTGLTSLESEE
jgi:acetoin utilization deacetylase AcuC-like enzyme